MGRSGTTIQDITIYLIAHAFALAIATGAARGTDYDSGGPVGKAPRWSNDFHHLQGTVVTPDCQLAPSAEYRADYVPGVDAWGRPVIPAETIRPYAGPPIVGELDVHLRQMQIAGHDISLIGKAPVPLGPAPGWPGYAGPPQDCFPAFK